MAITLFLTGKYFIILKIMQTLGVNLRIEPILMDMMYTGQNIINGNYG